MQIIYYIFQTKSVTIPDTVLFQTVSKEEEPEPVLMGPKMVIKYINAMVHNSTESLGPQNTSFPDRDHTRNDIMQIDLFYTLLSNTSLDEGTSKWHRHCEMANQLQILNKIWLTFSWFILKDFEKKFVWSVLFCDLFCFYLLAGSPLLHLSLCVCAGCWTCLGKVLSQMSPTKKFYTMLEIYFVSTWASGEGVEHHIKLSSIGVAYK